MTAVKFTVNRTGFHVVKAKKFSDLASSFPTEEIRVVWQEKNVISDAKSILGIMALDVTKGTVLELRAEGPNESEALDALLALWNEIE